MLSKTPIYMVLELLGAYPNKPFTVDMDVSTHAIQSASTFEQKLTIGSRMELQWSNSCTQL